VQIDRLVLDDGATLATAARLDAISHLSVKGLSGNTKVNGTSGNGVRLGPAGPGSPTIADQTPGEDMLGAAAFADAGPISAVVADPTKFGARPNDNIDDTAAIQAAIDSLPVGSGVPGSGRAGDVVGGLVTLGLGVFNTSAPLRIPSGVWLKGQGDGTTIVNNSFDPNSAAVLLVSSAAAPGNNAGAGVSDLGIKTNSGYGVRGDAGIINALVDLHLANLTISAGNTAIDLRAVKTYHASISNIGIYSPGGASMWIGDDAGYSADNRVVGVQQYGGLRPGFRVERAQFVFLGQNRIENVWMENASGGVLPMFISGSADLRGNWLEPPAGTLPDNVMIHFQDTRAVTIDRLFSVDDRRKLRLRNSPNVTIGGLTIFGRDNVLSDTLDVDGSSHITIASVAALRDPGMLDHPSVHVGGAFNVIAKKYVDVAPVTIGRNLLDDMSKWTVVYGDTLGPVSGTSSIEQTADGPRLRVAVTNNRSNRPVAVHIKVNVDASVAGKNATLAYRVDGPGTATVRTANFRQQYVSRAMNGMTVAPVPTPLASGDWVIVMLPPTTGVFYLSDFRMVANS
jgi:hypothetical protein